MSTSTTKRYRPVDAAKAEAGFSLVEILLGLTLALCLALGLAPVWVSFQALARDEGDRTVWVTQGRVAQARFERDLRLAGAGSCPFPSAGAILQAEEHQVVFVAEAAGSGAPILVEWELTNGALMRRWGPCPEMRPASFPHSIYTDNKTMLEGVDTERATFSYVALGRESASATGAEAALVDTLRLTLVERGAPATATPALVATAEVGR